MVDLIDWSEGLNSLQAIQPLMQNQGKAIARIVKDLKSHDRKLTRYLERHKKVITDIEYSGVEFSLFTTHKRMERQKELSREAFKSLKMKTKPKVEVDVDGFHDGSVFQWLLDERRPKHQKGLPKATYRTIATEVDKMNPLSPFSFLLSQMQQSSMSAESKNSARNSRACRCTTRSRFKRQPSFSWRYRRWNSSGRGCRSSLSAPRRPG